MSIIEVILGISIVVLILVSVSAYYERALRSSNLTTQRIQSGFLMEEGVNVVKMFRNNSWTSGVKTLSTSTTYYLLWNGSAWQATTSVQKIENTFTRSFVIQDVRRDAVTDDIVTSGGVYTTSTKKIIFSNSWKRGNATTTDTLETYISNLFFN